MTTRSKQRFSSILAGVSIIALSLLLVFIWTAVRNGVFNDNETVPVQQRSYPFQSINDASIEQAKNHSIHHHGHHSHHPHHRHHESMTLSGKFQTIFFLFRLIGNQSHMAIN